MLTVQKPIPGRIDRAICKQFICFTAWPIIPTAGYESPLARVDVGGWGGGGRGSRDYFKTLALN